MLEMYGNGGPNKSFHRTQAAFVMRLAMCEKLQASRAPNAGAGELFRYAALSGIFCTIGRIIKESR